MPAFSPTMTEGKISNWNVQEGDEVMEGQSIALIETDKAQVDFEVTENMFIAKLVKNPEDGMVSVGDVIAWAVEEESELKNFKLDDNSTPK